MNKVVILIGIVISIGVTILILQYAVPNSPQPQSSKMLMYAPSILPPIPQDFISNYSNQIQWNPDYHLRISDFIGKPNMSDDNVAWTHWQISITHYDIHFIGSYPNLRYNVTNIRFHAFFVTDQSWYKQNKTICNNETSYQLLQHEQGHWDLAEIFARKAYSEALTEFDNKTFSGEGDSSTIQQSNAYAVVMKKLSTIRDNVGNEMNEFDKIYEYYTKNGCNWESQAAYNEQFKNLRE